MAATLVSSPSVERREGPNPSIPTSSCVDERMANSTGKSERRLTAGQTAFISRYGEIRLDTSNLRFDDGDIIWVRIPVAVFISGCSSVGRARALGA